MLYFNKIDVSDGTDVNKTREWKECETCHYCYFLKKVLSFNQISAKEVIIY